MLRNELKKFLAVEVSISLSFYQNDHLSQVQQHGLDITKTRETKYVPSNLAPRMFPHYLLTGTTGGCSFVAKRPQHGLPRCLPRFPMARKRGRRKQEIIKA